MNQRIQKIIDDIERTKAKIAELQALLPELERKRLDAENTEIRRLLNSANIAPADVAGFIESIKQGRQDSRTNNHGQPPRNNNAGNGGANPAPEIRQEVSDNDTQ
jgi:restriction endonuclease S subunit